MPAGLLNTKGEPKPVYKVLDELINKEWRSDMSGALVAEGQLQGRGFMVPIPLRLWWTASLSQLALNYSKGCR